MDLGEPTTAILLNKHNPFYILNIYPVPTLSLLIKEKFSLQLVETIIKKKKTQLIKM